MLQSIFFLAMLIPSSVSFRLNVGTTLYGSDDIASNTWTAEDVAMLRSRQLVDRLIPTNLVNGRMFLDYVKIIVRTFETISNEKTRKIAMVSVADAFGGYLQGVMLPHVKRRYYEGLESYQVTDELHGLSRKIKFILDTDGRGWMTPVDVTAADITKNDDTDRPIFEESVNPCAALLQTSPDSDADAVPLPAFDDNKNPGSLAFPFVVGQRLFPVDMPWLSADDRRPLLVRYYRLAVGCTSSAPQQFQANMHQWLDSVVVPLLADRHRWFPVLAGATRVVTAAAKAAKAAGVNETLGGRHKRKATTNASTESNAANDVGDEEIRRSCDDGPDGRVPNSNVSLAVILFSHLFAWLLFWAFGSSERQSQTVSYSRRPESQTVTTYARRPDTILYLSD